MAIYQQLEQIVLDYLHQNLGQVDLFPGTTTPEQVETKVKELIVRGANNALKNSSQRHAFSFYEVDGYVLIPKGSSASLRNVLGDDGVYFDFDFLHFEGEVGGCTIPIRTSRGNKGHDKRFSHRDLCLVVKGSRISFNCPQDKDCLVKLSGNRKPYLFGEKLKCQSIIGGLRLTDYEAAEASNVSIVSEPSLLILDGVRPRNCYGGFGTDEFYVSDYVSHVLEPANPPFTFSPILRIAFDMTYPEQANAGTTLLLFVVTGEVTADNYALFLRDDMVAIDFWQDPMLEEGFEYLQWATIVEVNHLLQTFTPRTEGTLPPPTRSRDAAWDALMVADSYKNTDSELIQI